MAFDTQMQWLIFEGVLPMFGAGLIYILWGLMLAIARASWSPPFSWQEAIDPLGWLYGALIIAIQASVRCFAAKSSSSFLGWWSMICAGICFMFLLAAMGERGRNPQWRPGNLLKIFSSLAVIAALAVGYFAQPTLAGGASKRVVKEAQNVMSKAQ